MAQERKIVLSGMSEEEEARMRLLLRKAAPQLRETWTWGDDEDSADVVLTDPLTIAGNVAIANAKRRGMPYLVLSDAPRKGEERWTLRRPPTVVDLARLLNELELKEVQSLPVLSSGGADFYDLDLEGGSDAASVAEETETFREGSAPQTAAADDPDALFRRDPLARAVAVLKTHRLSDDTTLQAHGPSAASKRGELRAMDYGNPFMKDFDVQDKGVIGGVRAAPEEPANFTLFALLGKGIVVGPCQFHLPGHPALVLDPKLDVFHSSGRLAELRPYCARKYVREDWKPVTTQALKTVREATPARSFAELRFLCALSASKGHLDTKLDPGGTFWLQGVLPLDDSLSEERRILDAMPEARRLNEIVGDSRAPMARVMDVVNALQAIGMLGSRLRDRLR